MTKNLKILILILIIILLGAFILFNFMYKSSSPPLNPSTQTELQMEKDQAITELITRLATNPPPTEAQRDKALQDLSKRMKQ